MISLRCSALPLIFACPNSGDDPLRIDQRNEASDAGSAVHEAMQSYVCGLEPDLDALALRWGCDRDEIGRLTWAGRQAWAELAPSFPDAETEVAVRAELALSSDVVDLTGHVDLISRLGTRAHALDWKSGRLDHDYYAQVAGYAACLILGEGYEEVVITVVWLREGEAETYTFDRATIAAWLERFDAQLHRHGYVLGSHCQFCPRGHSCEAVIADARRASAVFGQEEFTPDRIAATVAALPPAARVELYRQAKRVEALASAARQAVRLNVIQSGGELDAGDGWVLKISEEGGRREVDTVKVWPLLEAHLNDDEVPTVIDVSASRFEDLVAKRAGRGKGAAAKRALQDEMKAADAVKQGTVLKLVERRKGQQ